ncbi:MAG: GDSL-type esterase/lipase family protein [Nakamurella sp.]
MRAGPVVSQIIRRTAVLLALLLVLTSLSATAVSAQSISAQSIGGLSHRPDLVVLGDSFAAGVGNQPYQPGTQTTCKRSGAAYGPQLDRWGLVNLQAFVACSGATTEQVWGPGRDGVVQIDSITPDTDLVTIGALGNNFHFGDISALCLLADCSRDKDLVPPNLGPPSGITVGQVLDSIPLLAPGQLDTLYQAIKGKLRPGGKVLVVEYAAPSPDRAPRSVHCART